MTELDEQCAGFRARLLFRASPDEYTVIFTANASHALKLVGEAYPFRPWWAVLLLADNHNSVMESASSHGQKLQGSPMCQ